MKVSQMINVLEQLDPDLDIFYVQNTGILAPVQSVQECCYRGFTPECFIGICCGKKVETDEYNASPVYISQNTRK
jgi:hypothetical protein